MPRLSARPAEQKKLLKTKGTLKAQLQPQLTRLQGWMQGGYVGFDLLPAALREVNVDVTSWSLGKQWRAGRGQWPAVLNLANLICRWHLPWRLPLGAGCRCRCCQWRRLARSHHM